MGNFVESEHPRDKKGQFIEKGKGVLKNSLVSYKKNSTQNEFKYSSRPNYSKIKEEYENAVDEEIVNFYNNQLKQRNAQGKLIVENATQKHIDEIKKLTGFDVTGYKISINDSFVGHVDNNHGINGIHDHSMKDSDDVGRLKYVLNNFDKIDFCRNKKGEIQHSTEHKDKNGNFAPKLLVQKRINGYYVICEAVVESKKKEIRLISAYKPKKPLI